MQQDQDKQITKIKNWLSTGSINLFGLPFSGKDTIGLKLAEALNAKLLSSGDILRKSVAQASKEALKDRNSGKLTPTDEFKNIILPYFKLPALNDYPLILSMVGRWIGEEVPTMEAAAASGHPIKAVVLLNVSEVEVKSRWEASQILKNRTGDPEEDKRADDKTMAILQTRFNEFNTKVMPVIQVYQKMGILIPVNAKQNREEVFSSVINSLANFIPVAEHRPITFKERN